MPDPFVRLSLPGVGLRGALRATSFVVPAGGSPTLRDDIVECLHEALDGPTTIDQEEASRGYHAARKAADERLAVLYAEIVKEFGTDIGILPQDVQDVGLAWVRAR